MANIAQQHMSITWWIEDYPQLIIFCLFPIDCVTNDFVDGININQAMIKSGYCVRDKYWIDQEGYLPWELDVKAMAKKYGVSVVTIIN